MNPARAIEKRFPGQTRTVTVRMKHGKAVERFVRRVEDAHRRTAKSRQVW